MNADIPFPLVGMDGDDDGFRLFLAEDDASVRFNLAETRIWIVGDRPELVGAARDLYFDLKCASKIRSGNWKTAVKAGSVLRYRRGGKGAMEPPEPSSWPALADALNQEGLDYFFNRKVFEALFCQDDVPSATASLFSGLLGGRAHESDRVASASAAALFCLQAAGAILLPVGWASRYGGIRTVWPGAQENLTRLMGPDERLFVPLVQAQLKATRVVLAVDEAKGGHRKRGEQAYRVLKMLLSALPHGFQMGLISGEMFIAAVELLVRMRDATTFKVVRDRRISNLRLIWNVIAPLRLGNPGASEETKQVRDYIVSFVNRRGDAALSEVLRRRRGHQMRKERDLRWVVEEAPHLAPIVDLGREYISSGTAYVTATLSRGFEKLFEYLIDRPDRISDLPSLGREDFRGGGICCEGHGGFPSFVDYIRSARDVDRNPNRGSNKGARSDGQMNLILNATLNFLEWYRDANNANFQVPLYRTDIPGQTRRGWNHGKSTKLPVPIRVLNLCRRILTENDYAWPRTLDEDYVLVTRADGTSVREWCPVRAVALLSLFWLPIRGVSVRRLDSGEGDEILYDARSRAWVPNHLPTAEPRRSVGVIHRVLEMDDAGKALGGFFINSNKTKNARIKLSTARGPNKSAFNFGYIIPWDNHEFFRHLAYCRDWQAEKNPISAPRGLDEITDHSIRVTKTVARNLPGFYFLFRDPFAGNDPLSAHRLTAMFDRILKEAGRRLSEEEGRIIDLSSYFTLHSLRVGGITAFMKSGVPLGVLTEFIAGHATVIMNLYYQRHSAPEINRIISEAAASLESGKLLEEDLFDRIARISDDLSVGGDESFSAQGLVFRHQEAFEHLRRTQKGLVLIDIDGCCPVGGTMCDLGGPLNQRGEAQYNPLGVRGCSTCRFHVTGEPFLAGMVIKANEAIYRLRSLATAIRDLEGELGILERARSGAHRVLQSRLDGLNLMAEQLMMEWSARVQSILMTTGQMRDATNREGRALLVAKEHVAFEEASEFRLTDFLARASEVVLLESSVSGEVRLRRRATLDRLLDENGLAPFLFALPDPAAQRSANKLVDMLIGAIGWDGMDAALDRRATLSELGFAPEQLNSLRHVESISDRRASDWKTLSLDRGNGVR